MCTFFSGLFLCEAAAGEKAVFDVLTAEVQK